MKLAEKSIQKVLSPLNPPPPPPMKKVCFFLIGEYVW